jgi:hypothetical protein
MCSPCRIPKVSGVALDDLEDGKCHTYRIPKDRGEIRQCLYDEIAALSGFLKHLGLHPLQLVRGE